VRVAATAASYSLFPVGVVADFPAMVVPRSIWEAGLPPAGRVAAGVEAPVATVAPANSFQTVWHPSAMGAAAVEQSRMAPSKRPGKPAVALEVAQRFVEPPLIVATLADPVAAEEAVKLPVHSLSVSVLAMALTEAMAAVVAGEVVVQAAEEMVASVVVAAPAGLTARSPVSVPTVAMVASAEVVALLMVELSLAAPATAVASEAMPTKATVVEVGR